MNLSKRFKVSGLAVLLASTSILTVSLNKALADGGFASSCINLILYKQDPGMLYAHCRRPDGSLNKLARIQLNDYITNNNGRLAWQPNGNFMGSCVWNTDNFEITALLQSPEQNFIVLQTFCRNNAGRRVRTGINLNERIRNDNGDLRYGGPQ